MKRSLFGLPLAVAALALTGPAPASAADLTVTTSADAGDGSLRDRINSAGTSDRVLIPSSVGPIVLSASLTITKAITVQGAGPAITSISGNDAVRVFVVAPPAQSAAGVTLRGLTIRDGKATDEGGAGVLHDHAENNGTLTLDDVTIRDCVAGGATSGGAAVYSEHAPLTITGSDIVDNAVTTTLNQSGGAVVADGGRVTVTDSEISRNTLTSTASAATFDHGYNGGGAIRSVGALPAEAPQSVKITGSFLRDNRVTIDPPAGQTAGDDNGGGAVWSTDGLVTAIDSVFDGNSVVVKDLVGGGSGGGAIWNYFANTELADTLVTGNTVSLTAPDDMLLGSSGGGGLWVNHGDASILDSTISDNTVTTGPARLRDVGGGGLLSNSAPYAIQGSTFSGNQVTATATTENGWSGGGAMLIEDNVKENFALNSTFANNSVTITNRDLETDGGGAIHQTGENGEGIFKNVTVSGNSTNGRGGAFLEVPLFVNTIIAGNTSADQTNCSYFTLSPDDPTPPVLSGGHNLEDRQTCNLAKPGDMTGTNPRLKPLGDYGGPTQTFDLELASPARDSGSDCPNRDQRGLARPFGPACDIGAVEGGAVTQAPVDDDDDVKPTPKPTPKPPPPPPPPSSSGPPRLIVCGGSGTVVPQCLGQIPKPDPIITCGPSFGTILRSCKGLGLKLGVGPRPSGLETLQTFDLGASIPVEMGCGEQPGRARMRFGGSIVNSCSVTLRGVAKDVLKRVVPTLTPAIQGFLTSSFGTLGALSSIKDRVLAGFQRFEGGMTAPNADVEGVIANLKRLSYEEDRLEGALLKTALAASDRRRAPAAQATRQGRALFTGLLDTVQKIDRTAGRDAGWLMGPELRRDVTTFSEKGKELIDGLDKLGRTLRETDEKPGGRRTGPSARAAAARLDRRLSKRLDETSLVAQSVEIPNGTQRTVRLKLPPEVRRALGRLRGRKIALTLVADVVRGGTTATFKRTLRVRIAGKAAR